MVSSRPVNYVSTETETVLILLVFVSRNRRYSNICCYWFMHCDFGLVQKVRAIKSVVRYHINIGANKLSLERMAISDLEVNYLNKKHFLVKMATI